MCQGSAKSRLLEPAQFAISSGIGLRSGYLTIRDLPRYRGSANLPAISLALLLCYLPSLDAGDLARLAGSAIARRVLPGQARGPSMP
jgi:hypothetical protein